MAETRNSTKITLALKRAERFLEMFVADGEPPSLITPDGVDHLEFAQAWDAAHRAIKEALPA